MTTPLEALKAALEAKREAFANGRDVRRHGGNRTVAKDVENATASRLADLLTDDTIAALIAVAEADDPEPPYDDAYTWGGDIYECWRRRQELRAPLFPKEADDEG